MGGKTMPKDVRAFFINSRYERKPFLHCQVSIFNIKCISFFIYKQGFCFIEAFPSEAGFFSFLIQPDIFYKRMTYWNHSFLISFTKHSNSCCVCVQLAVFKRNKLSKPDAGIIKDPDQ